MSDLSYRVKLAWSGLEDALRDFILAYEDGADTDLLCAAYHHAVTVLDVHTSVQKELAIAIGDRAAHREREAALAAKEKDDE